jgi:ABC-type methionine transport system ATPase subunit
MLLDDVLSAVDSTTSSLILQQLVGVDGLLRRLGTTVIMTTHSCANITPQPLYSFANSSSGAA